MQYLSPFPGFRKTRILVRREEELRHAIRHGQAAERIARAAERVRTARLHLLKALRHAALPCRAEDVPKAEAHLRNLAEQVALWERRSVESVVAEYAAPVDPPCPEA